MTSNSYAQSLHSMADHSKYLPDQPDEQWWIREILHPLERQYGSASKIPESNPILVKYLRPAASGEITEQDYYDMKAGKSVTPRKTSGEHDVQAERRLKVWNLWKQGMVTQSIADKLGVSYSTAKNDLYAMKHKTDDFHDYPVELAVKMIADGKSKDEIGEAISASGFTLTRVMNQAKAKLEEQS